VNYLHIRAKSELPRMGRLEDDAEIIVDFDEMFASRQFVRLRRAASSREKASCIRPCSEGLSLSTGADFSGIPRTFRLCWTNCTYAGEHFGRLESFVGAIWSMWQRQEDTGCPAILKHDLFLVFSSGFRRMSQDFSLRGFFSFATASGAASCS